MRTTATALALLLALAVSGSAQEEDDMVLRGRVDEIPLEALLHVMSAYSRERFVVIDSEVLRFAINLSGSSDGLTVDAEGMHEMLRQAALIHDVHLARVGPAWFLDRRKEAIHHAVPVAPETVAGLPPDQFVWTSLPAPGMNFRFVRELPGRAEVSLHQDVLEVAGTAAEVSRTLATFRAAQAASPEPAVVVHQLADAEIARQCLAHLQVLGAGPKQMHVASNRLIVRGTSAQLQLVATAVKAMEP